jgi:hypothetical protein
MTHRPVGVGASFNFSAGTATTSTAFSVQSDTIRVVAVGAAAHIAVGGTPSATTADYFVPSGGTATLALTKASNRIVGVTTGTSTVLTCPEGTQLPFGVGDYVTLTGASEALYNFISAEVLSVDTSSGVGGLFQTRMTVNYNSSGILTAFSSSNASVVTANKVSARGVGAGTLYYQQVQLINKHNETHQRRNRKSRSYY